jgi:hypothetical protein
VADRKVSYDVIANDKSSKTLTGIGGQFDSLGSKVKSVGKGIALAAGGVALGGIAALGVGMVQGVKDAAAYQTLQKKTEAVLKSTGNAAGTSVSQIQSHAGALESLSGVDEDLIINGQNVLATFTNVQNKLGKGNDIFDQATKTALDMSTALGSDLQGANIQLGKALNDPIKGISALSKVGVSFTQQQKDQIKALVESGDTLGAQKVILAELGKEFGGAAKAAGSGFEGSIARLKDTVGDTFKAIGLKALPTLTKLADTLADRLPAAIKWAQDAWFALSTAFTTKDPTGAFTDGFLKLQKAGVLLRAGFDATVATLKTVGGALKSTGSFLSTYRDIIIPIAGGVLAMVAAWKTYVLVTKLVAAATKAWAAVQVVLNVVMTANPIGIIVLAIVGLVAAFVLAYRNSDRFRAIVQTGMALAKAAILGLVAGAKAAFEGLKNAFTAVKTAVTNVLVGAFRFAVGAVLGYLGFIINGAARAFGWIPGIGPKLKAAAAQFNTFANSVNASLAKIRNKQVTVTIRKNTIDYSNGVTRSRNRNSPNAMRAHGGGVSVGMAYQVNEQGQELLRLNDRSAAVIPHARSQRMLRSNGGGGGDTYIINASGMVGDRRGLARELVALLAEAKKSGTLVT